MIALVSRIRHLLGTGYGSKIFPSCIIRTQVGLYTQSYYMYNGRNRANCFLIE